MTINPSKPGETSVAELPRMNGHIGEIAAKAVEAAKGRGQSVYFWFNGVKVWARPTSDHRDVADMALLAMELDRLKNTAGEA